MTALIYSKNGCSYCTAAKKLMDEKGISYTETIIGNDMLAEDFKELFPAQKTVPLIFINGERIGGYRELIEWDRSRNQRQLLEE